MYLLLPILVGVGGFLVDFVDFFDTHHKHCITSQENKYIGVFF